MAKRGGHLARDAPRPDDGPMRLAWSCGFLSVLAPEAEPLRAPGCLTLDMQPYPGVVISVDDRRNKQTSVAVTIGLDVPR